MVNGAPFPEVMWPVLLNKAWAKIKGNYMNSKLGLIQNSLRTLTGFPVIYYSLMPGIIFVDGRWETFERYSKLEFPMVLEASLNHNQEINECNLRSGSAYAVITTFNMTGEDQTQYKMFMVRNPESNLQHNKFWNKNDQRWTDHLVS